MPRSESIILFRRLDAYERRLCLRLNRACRVAWLRLGFAGISRAGNGVFWYALLALLPILYGAAGVYTGLRLVAAGVLGLLIYKLLKGRLVRHRPATRYRAIQQGAAPLDRYSFPSGHTLHAVAFTTLGIQHDVRLAWILLPFTVLVALSRVVLGLHYPSDVLAGLFIGLVIAALILML